MKKVILLSVGISCCIGLCACGVDKSSVIYPMQKNDNGLYYYTEDDKENVLYYYDKTTGKSQVISENYSLFIQDNGKSSVFDSDHGIIMLDRDEQDLYMLEDDVMEFVAKLDLDHVNSGSEDAFPYERFIFKITEESIFWGICDIQTDSNEISNNESEVLFGIYKQNLRDGNTSVILETYYNDYFDIIGCVENTIYIRTNDEKLLSINMETGEEALLYEDGLLSVNNLISVYDDGIIIFENNVIYWSGLEQIDFKITASLQGYNQVMNGIDRMDNIVYFPVESETANNGNDNEEYGIAALDLDAGEISLYHTFTGWKNRNLRVSDIVIADAGFYYINSVHGKMAGNGLYYYDAQENEYIRISN